MPPQFAILGIDQHGERRLFESWGVLGLHEVDRGLIIGFDNRHTHPGVTGCV